METVARLISATLDACFQHGVIDWLPSEGDMPESLQAECEIEFNGYTIGDHQSGDYYVWLLGVFCIIGLEDIPFDNCTWWHSEVVEA